MSDLISRQEVLEALTVTEEMNTADLLWLLTTRINNLPSAEPEKVCIAKITLSEEQIREAVEKAKSEIVQVLPSAEPVIRCKDCENWMDDVEERSACGHYCPMADRWTEGSWFCADGEKKK